MMQFGQAPSWWILTALVTTFASQAVAESTAKETERFVRLIEDEDGAPVSLQTSVARYQGTYKNRTVVVDLVGAVHLADKQYYEQLNKLFESYDKVLYEFVAPEGLEVPDPERPSGSPISFLQQSFKSILGLSSQLDHVDYKRDNFVHADMSPKEMSEAMQKRGDNMLSFMLSALADITRNSSAQAALMDESDLEAFDPIALLTDPQAGHKLKIQMAKQFDRMGATDMAMGATINQLLVEDRNQAAMRELAKQLDAGYSRYAIFYGAAHMNDFQRRLQQEHQLTHVGTEWLTAWDLEKPTSGKVSLTSLLFEAMQQAE